MWRNASATVFSVSAARSFELERRESAVCLASATTSLARFDIQMHGGVGFTWANDAHFLFKRAKQNEVLIGGVSQARRRLASLFIESA